MAVWQHLGERVDYGMLVKIYGDGSAEDQRRYSPARIIEAKRTRIFGVPEKSKICTSHIERFNGSTRTFGKRMSRLTYCFSKNMEQPPQRVGAHVCTLQPLPRSPLAQRRDASDGARLNESRLDSPRIIGNSGHMNPKRHTARPEYGLEAAHVLEAALIARQEKTGFAENALPI